MKLCSGIIKSLSSQHPQPTAFWCYVFKPHHVVWFTQEESFIMAHRHKHKLHFLCTLHWCSLWLTPYKTNSFLANGFFCFTYFCDVSYGIECKLWLTAWQKPEFHHCPEPNPKVMPPLDLHTSFYNLLIKSWRLKLMLKWCIHSYNVFTSCLLHLYSCRTRQTSQSPSHQWGGLHHISILHVSQQGSSSKHGHRLPEGKSHFCSLSFISYSVDQILQYVKSYMTFSLVLQGLVFSCSDHELLLYFYCIEMSQCLPPLGNEC